jgi:hypothetical protein
MRRLDTSRIGLALQPPEVGEDVGCARVAQIPILLDGVSNNSFELWRDGGVEQCGRLRRAIEDLIEDDRRRHAFERPPPGGHLVEHDPKREEIASRIHLLAARLFRRHVGDRPDGRPGTADRVILGRVRRRRCRH